MPIMLMDEYEDPNHLDITTRQRMVKTSDNENEFWIYLFIVLMIFMVGFITGNVVHDSCCHVLEHKL